MRNENILNISRLFKIASENYIIELSNIHGQGTFAKHDFGTNQEIQLALKFDKESHDVLTFIRTSFAKKVNHEIPANMYLKKIGMDFYFCAARFISSGEELTTDYNKYKEIIKRESLAFGKAIKVL